MIARYRRLALGLTLVWLLVRSDSDRAGACVCSTIEPDAAYQQALVVFTGTVETVTDITTPVVHDGKPLLISQGRVTRMTVDEYFKGRGGTELELIGGNTSCDIGFEPRKRYLVYASQSGTSGALGAFSCSRTGQHDDHVKPDISYLRRAARGEQPTMLYGFVFRSAWNYSSKRGQQDPLSDVTVTVQGQGKRLDLKTDASGYFETFELPPGSYRVQTALTGKLRGADERAVEIRGGGVTSVIFHTTSMGSLRGRLVDQDGRPAKELNVELLPAGGVPGAAVKDYVTTGENGEFVFGELPNGRYVLAVNSADRPSLYGAPFRPSYFPNAASIGDAEPITIEDAVPVELSDFVLQGQYPTVAVSGIVVTSGGEPVPGAYVYLDKSGRPWDAARPVQTDAAGRFVHRAFEGVTYTLHANADGANSSVLESDRVEITAVKSAAQVRLVVKRGR